MTAKLTTPRRFLLLLLVGANLLLFFPPAHPLRVGGAILLMFVLPGLNWANRFTPTGSFLLRGLIAAALSTIATLSLTLLLHYLPGPLQSWQLLVGLNGLAVLPLFFSSPVPSLKLAADDAKSLHLSYLIPLGALVILLRFTNLGYSEFQGDEALTMISAAEALEGHEKALFLRAKGPGEVLLPMALWRLSGTINEPLARLPFAFVGLLIIPTIYLIGNTLGPPHRFPHLGGLAALFFALNGFSLAFSRIVQYQALVLWFSSLALLLVIQWRRSHQDRYAFLAGLGLGAGLLAHYDAILVLPAIGWLFLADLMTPRQTLPPSISPAEGPVKALEGDQSLAIKLRAILKPGFLFLTATLLVALPFYLPFSLDPQANRTGDYVSGRIGSELRNNLPDFFHFNTFYSSFYYILFTGLLVLGGLLWLVGRARWGRWWLVAPLGLAVLGLVLNPDLLVWETVNLAALPFVLLLAGAFFALPFKRDSANLQAVIAWLAGPFLGYNFVVALGLTHIYTIVPAWSLVAALAWSQLPLTLYPSRGQVNTGGTSSNYLVSFWRKRSGRSPTVPGLARSETGQSVSHRVLVNLVIPLFALLCLVFLWNAFIRHEVEYWQDYPAGNLPIFWSPYDEPPLAGFFGFAHRTGWKAVGQKIVTGELSGDYGSNEEPDVTTWYTRGAPRACDPQPEYYFLADDLIDPVDIPAELIETRYEQIGQVTLPNQKRLRLMQQTPPSLALGDLPETALASAFDQSASPAAFARSARGAVERQANFGNLVQLIGYDLDTRRARPGGRLPITLYWQALAPISTSYQVFTHLESDQTGLIAQADGVPVCWTYPTDLWRPGQIIADQHAITIPPEALPGRYPLQIGLYLADTFERLELLDEAGNPAGTSLILTTVEISE